MGGSLAFRPKGSLRQLQSLQCRPDAVGSGLGGQVARIAFSSCCSQGCNTALGAAVTVFARTSPVAGRNKVSSLAVPPRRYSWDRRDGCPSGCQEAPACGMA